MFTLTGHLENEISRVSVKYETRRQMRFNSHPGRGERGRIFYCWAGINHWAGKFWRMCGERHIARHIKSRDTNTPKTSMNRGVYRLCRLHLQTLGL